MASFSINSRGQSNSMDIYVDRNMTAMRVLSFIVTGLALLFFMFFKSIKDCVLYLSACRGHSAPSVRKIPVRHSSIIPFAGMLRAAYCRTIRWATAPIGRCEASEYRMGWSASYTYLSGFHARTRPELGCCAQPKLQGQMRITLSTCCAHE